MKDSLNHLIEEIGIFSEERDWQQFHFYDLSDVKILGVFEKVI
jgi:hypothetical protein